MRTVLEASEAFCCGTGATVTPVGSVHYKPGHDELETETVTLTFMRVPVYVYDIWILLIVIIDAHTSFFNARKLFLLHQMTRI